MSVYESYVAIPLPWLSQMPSHWTLLRNKNFLQEVKETVGINSADYTLLSLTKNGIIPRDVASGKGKFPKDFDTYKVVTSGDLAFCLFDIDETPRTVGLSKHDGMLTGAYTVFHLSGINPQFITYYYLALDNAKSLRPLYSGLRKTIKTNIFLGMKLPVPPREEQDQIVRYLDWQVSKTNKLISALKKQIALLKEQKQAVINEAVTKGLDPSVPMKDSGVDWVGEIPAHWRITKIGNHFTIKKRIARSEGFSVLSITQQGLKIKDISTNEGQMAANYSGYQFVYPGEFAMNHMDLLTGYIDISTYHGVTSPDYRVFGLEDTDNCLAEYYLYLFQLCYKRRIFYGFGRGAANQGRWRMPAVNFRNFIIPLPEYDEQAQIVAHLNEQCAEVDTLIENISNEITVLGEYRTRLISDVVTGQIDVRAVEVPDFEYITDEAEDASDDENSDVEEAEEE